ncbi:unnamed protein product [Cylicocyclus nassatus]|uniref:Uncharacterized protein n=1 Tax=Cylicocyclus nassatus TaxID=53992 RepID=A0AA36M745_CYLNA|nr:unnamed protein product [Cylicocyclus nassatus]
MATPDVAAAPTAQLSCEEEGQETNEEHERKKSFKRLRKEFRKVSSPSDLPDFMADNCDCLWNRSFAHSGDYSYRHDYSRVDDCDWFCGTGSRRHKSRFKIRGEKVAGPSGNWQIVRFVFPNLAYFGLHMGLLGVQFRQLRFQQQKLL